MDRINEITSECFIALSQLRELDGGAIAPEAVHGRLKGFVDALRAKAREQGQSGKEADDIAYAIVALADEVAMGKPEPLRGYWMGQPLQLVFFNETLAGEGFFTRLAEIRRDPRRADTLRVYYQCLLFGFQGKYSIRGGDLELMRLIDSMRPEIERQIEPPDSPVAGRRASRRAAGARLGQQPLSLCGAGDVRGGHRRVRGAEGVAVSPDRRPGRPGGRAVALRPPC